MAKENVNFIAIMYIFQNSLPSFRLVFPSILILYMAITVVILGKNIRNCDIEFHAVAFNNEYLIICI